MAPIKKTCPPIHQISLISCTFHRNLERKEKKTRRISYTTYAWKVLNMFKEEIEKFRYFKKKNQRELDKNYLTFFYHISTSFQNCISLFCWRRNFSFSWIVNSLNDCENICRSLSDLQDVVWTLTCVGNLRVFWFPWDFSWILWGFQPIKNPSRTQ